MSCILYSIIELHEEMDTREISDFCFELVAFACKKKIAINKIDILDAQISYLKKNEMGLLISNDYVHCTAEEFMEVDFNSENPYDGVRLKDLEEFLAFVMEFKFTKSIRLYMMTQEQYNGADFEKISDKLYGFADKYKDKILFESTFAYEFVFQK